MLLVLHEPGSHLLSSVFRVRRVPVHVYAADDRQAGSHKGSVSDHCHRRVCQSVQQFADTIPNVFLIIVPTTVKSTRPTGEDCADTRKFVLVAEFAKNSAG